MQNKNRFIQLLKKTERDGIDNLITWLETTDFYIAPASTRYHGAYLGGLLEHSLNVYDNLVSLSEFSSRQFDIEELNTDSIVLCSLLHDLCKIDTYEEYTKNMKIDGAWQEVLAYRKNTQFSLGHGAKSVFLAQNFIKLSPEEAQAIYWHMGAYDLSNYSTMNELSDAYKYNKLAFLLNQADMFTTYITENNS